MVRDTNDRIVEGSQNMNHPGVYVLGTLGLDHLDRLDDRIRIQGEVFCFFLLNGSGVFLPFSRLGLRGFYSSRGWSSNGSNRRGFGSSNRLWSRNFFLV